MNNDNFDILKEIQKELVNIRLESLSIDEERTITAKIIDTYAESYDLIVTLFADDEKPDFEKVVRQLNEIEKQCEAGWSKLSYLDDRNEANNEKGEKLLENLKDIGEIL